MKTILHLDASGQTFWQKDKTGWRPLASEKVTANDLIFVVTDFAEEIFAEVKVPRLFGRDRSDFIERQLQSRFPDTPFRTVLKTPSTGKLLDRLAPLQQVLFAVDSAARVNLALDTNPSMLAGVWASSALIARLACIKTLPPDIFVVMPGNGSLRIVFLRDRRPVLARLAPCSNTPSDQAAEVVRTLRHLENTRVVERSQQRYPVWVLGHADTLIAPLVNQGLDVVSAPAHWNHGQPVDWRSVIFDLASTAPSAQLAPSGRRTRVLGNKLRLASYGVASLCLVAAGWTTAQNVNSGWLARKANAREQTELAGINANLAKVEQRLDEVGVSPDLVRQAVALDLNEIVGSPGLSESISAISLATAMDSKSRFTRYESRSLADEETACAKAAKDSAVTGSPSTTEAAPSSDLPTTTHTSVPGAKPPRRIEILVEFLPSESLMPRERARSIAKVSKNLQNIPGVTLVVDPAKAAANGILSNSSQHIAGPAPAWCLTLIKNGVQVQQVKGGTS